MQAQIIATTHSPYLVDKTDIDDLIVVEKSNGATKCTRPASKAHLKELLEREELGLGELWYSGAWGQLVPTYGIVVEGDYDSAALPEIIKKCLSSDIEIIARPCGDKSQLMKKFPGFLEAFRYAKEVHLLIRLL